MANSSVQDNFKKMYPKEPFTGKMYKKLKDIFKLVKPIIEFNHLSDFKIDQELLNLMACCLNNDELTPPQIINQLVIPFNELISHRVGEFVSIKGIVSKLGNIRPVWKVAVYSCKTCSQLKTIYIHENEKPTKCDKLGCKSKSFHFERDHEFIRTINMQSIYIQENLFEGLEGRVPKRQEVLLFGEHLVDKIRPGDECVISGILHVTESRDNLYSFILYGNSIQSESLKIKKQIFSNEMKRQIKELINDPNIVKKMIDSFCVNIEGMEQVKFGLMLSLFGPTKRKDHDMRDQIHILLLGEPGKGKSVLLNALGQASPRGFYVCGSSGVTNSGLTIALIRDGPDFSIEAGPLVLADKGHCIIDELDKLPDKAPLLEAMEQGEIRMAKAGLKIHLKARTSVICAANPKGGRFMPYKTLNENVNIPFALFSRFDLVFPIIDNQNDTLVEKVVRIRHIIKHPDIPINTLQALIRYGREFITPVISEEAKAILKEFYLKLRRATKHNEISNITIRHLESMIRLSEARAKMEFKDEVTKEHAQDIVTLMESTMFKSLNVGLAVELAPVKTKGRPNDLLKGIERHCARNSNNITIQEIRQIGSQYGLVGNMFFNAFDKLNEQAFLLKNQDGSYKFRNS
eukprot:NODE_180_length_13923_cov_0.697772.p3 type:complete len:631 gc:universal NODE_180_length_13923_cov_0.697772:8137-6245(-)